MNSYCWIELTELERDRVFTKVFTDGAFIHENQRDPAVGTEKAWDWLREHNALLMYAIKGDEKSFINLRFCSAVSMITWLHDKPLEVFWIRDKDVALLFKMTFGGSQ